MLKYKLIFIIPGNPGIAEYYENLKNLLEQNLKKKTSIFILPYNGFQKSKPEKLYDLIEEFNYKLGQIESIIDYHKPNQKRKITSKIAIDRTKFYKQFEISLIGHSIGGWIAKELAIKNPELPIKNIFFVFPFLKLDNHSKIQNILKFLLNSNLTTNFVLAIYNILQKIPLSLLSKILNGLWKSMNLESQKITHDYFLKLSHIPKSVIHLAKSEFLHLDREINFNFFTSKKTKIHLIYNDQDIWAPISHLDEIQKFNPHIPSTLIKGKLHDFCTSDSGNKIISDIILNNLNT